MSDMIENPLPSIPDGVKEKFYDDAIHPVAKQAGRIAETVGMIVNKKLEPIRQWASYGIENNEKLEQEVQKRLAGTSPDDIITPPKEIAVPTIIANSYTDSDVLRSLYANLLSKAMDKTENSAHPSYVEIIKQLSPDEALLLKESPLLISPTATCAIRYQHKSTYDNYMSYRLHPANIIRDYENGHDILPYYIPHIVAFPPEQAARMIDNFIRLRLLECPDGLTLTDENAYSMFFMDNYMQSIDLSDDSEQELAHTIGVLTPTEFGKHFYGVCIDEPSETPAPLSDEDIEAEVAAYRAALIAEKEAALASSSTAAAKQA